MSVSGKAHLESPTAPAATCVSLVIARATTVPPRGHLTPTFAAHFVLDSILTLRQRSIAALFGPQDIKPLLVRSGEAVVVKKHEGAKLRFELPQGRTLGPEYKPHRVRVHVECGNVAICQQFLLADADLAVVALLQGDINAQARELALGRGANNLNLSCAPVLVWVDLQPTAAEVGQALLSCTISTQQVGNRLRLQAHELAVH